MYYAPVSGSRVSGTSRENAIRWRRPCPREKIAKLCSNLTKNSETMSFAKHLLDSNLHCHNFVEYSASLSHEMHML